MKSRKNWIFIAVILMIPMLAWVHLRSGGRLNLDNLTGMAVSIGFLCGVAWLLLMNYAGYTRAQARLKSVLDATSEAIFGVDHQGICTFVNQRCLELLGFQLEEELIGKPIHGLIRHTRVDGSACPPEECPILEMISSGQPSFTQESIFFRKDGQSLLVELRARPQFMNSEVTGAVVTFMDHSLRKKTEERLRFLTFHDRNTGLYNQAYFHEELDRINTPENHPISLIMGDVNELKLVNDIFGHKAGDLLLSRIGLAIQAACRPEDAVARVGGDEFMILLPRTDEAKAAQILQAVQESVGAVEVSAVRGSISLGLAVKTAWQEDFTETSKIAEEEMYRNKIMTQRAIDAKQLELIMARLVDKNPGEKIHSVEVSQLAQSLAQTLQLSSNEIRQARDAGYYHDIGKIALTDDILNRKETLSPKQFNEMEKHSVVGYRILNLFSETLDLAQGVLEHHENWDGSGYPKGLAGEEISLLARIISAA